MHDAFAHIAHFTETVEQMVYRRIFERLAIAESKAVDYAALAEEDQPQLTPEQVNRLLAL